MSECPFCHVPRDDIVDENRGAFVMRDRFPVSPGHTLVIPFRHVERATDLDPAESFSIQDLIEEQCYQLEMEGADGFNIGVNVGRAAGQTVMHVHYHIIPRYFGDQEDPRGGIRKIFPDKAAYWWNPIP